MFGRFSPKSLTVRIFFWLVVIVLLTMVPFLLNSSLWWGADTSLNHSFSDFTKSYFLIKMIVQPIAGLFLVWHGCDVLYRILAVCECLRENK